MPNNWGSLFLKGESGQHITVSSYKSDPDLRLVSLHLEERTAVVKVFSLKITSPKNVYGGHIYLK